MTAMTRLLLVCLVVLTAGLVGVRAVRQPVRRPKPITEIHLPVDECVKVIEQRCKVKERIVLCLLEGEIGLLEAAAWFRFLNESPPEHPDVYWRNIPGGSDGEKLCRQVIYWTSVIGKEKMTASQAQERIDDLEQELSLHVACNGAIELPRW